MDNQKQLLQAIKTNDARTFSSLVGEKKGYLSLCYGRFPILSICYLYNSKKILSQYAKQLFMINSYTIIDEDIEIYKEFRKIAGKSLRLYVKNDIIVSPLEVLALLDDSISLTEVYPNAYKNQQIIENIATIYRINHNEIVSTERNYIQIKNKKLSGLQYLLAITSLVVASIMILLSSSLWVTLHYVFGNGTSNSPYRISTESQLKLAINQGDKNYILTKDINLSNQWETKDFSGVLDGNGKTIFIKNNINDSFIDTLNGTLKNMHFSLAKYDRAITDNLGIIVQINNGSIENSHIRIDGKFTKTSIGGDVDEDELEEYEDVYISCLVHENNGNIIDSSINADINLVGDGKNAFFAGVASINNGTVDNCSTTEDTRIITDTLDVAGLVINNNEDGIVINCTNNAEIKQSSASDSWLPNASGVVLNNFGEVNSCFNYGEITAKSTAKEKFFYVYLGGVVCTNYGFILKSKNNANLIAESHQYHIHAGGVTSVNAVIGSTINNCCSYGKITVRSVQEENIYKFAGGICSQNNGRIHNSYSASTFSEPQDHTYLGGISSLTDAMLTFSGLFPIVETHSKNNYYIVQDNISYGIAALSLSDGQQITIYDENAISEEQLNQGIIKQDNLEQLESKEIFWG